MAAARSMPRIGLVLAAWALVAAASAVAQGDGRTVYRCADGQYSQTPCPGGRLLDPGPGPTPQQQREAREAAATDARLAEQLRQERHARERAAVGQGPARIGPLPEDARAAKPKRATRSGEKSSRPPKATNTPKAPKPHKLQKSGAAPKPARDD